MCVDTMHELCLAVLEHTICRPRGELATVSGHELGVAQWGLLGLEVFGTVLAVCCQVLVPSAWLVLIA
jgi:hypothetical protein